MKNYIPPLIYETVIYEEVTKRKKENEGLTPVVYDEATFKHTDIGYRRDEMQILFQVYKDDPMNQNVVRYWAKKGLKKEVFDNEGKYGFDALYEYSVFTPLDMDPQKKYALVYVCHGGGQCIEWAENYGFNTLAATEKYIVVYAQNGGRSHDGVETEFPRIMEELRKKGYPIDWERVYTVGFSSGSNAAAVCACNCPDIVAAVGCMPDGIPFESMEFYTGSEYYECVKNRRIPGIFIGGTADRGAFPAPWMKDYTGNGLNCGTVENALENLNIWMRDLAKIPSAQQLTRASITDKFENGENPAEREFGMKFDRTYEFRTQGTDWLGGEFYGTDGAPVMRWARAKGVPHMVWESQANIVWDYLKHFHRNPRTGESIYDPFVCWGER